MGLLLIAALLLAGRAAAVAARAAASCEQRRHLGLRLRWRRPRGCSTPRPRSPRCWSGCSAGCFVRGRTSPADLPLFPQQADFHSEVPDAVLDEVVLPTFRFGAWLFSWFRVFQQGNIQIYLLYIFLALIALLLWR